MFLRIIRKAVFYGRIKLNNVENDGEIRKNRHMCTKWFATKRTVTFVCIRKYNKISIDLIL